MSEVVFGANQQPVPPSPSPAASVPATVPSGAVQRAQGPLLGDSLPEFTNIILPRLNMVQNIGGMKDSFNSGELVFDQRVVIYTPQIVKGTVVERVASAPVGITLMGFKPNPVDATKHIRFVEKVEGGARGMICNTEAEVRANGGTLDWSEWKLKKASGIKLFQQLADALVLVERPAICVPKEGMKDPIFVYEVDGKRYALAFWALKGTTFTAAYKRVFGPARLTGFLREGGNPSWSFALSTREETYQNGNKAWVPVVVPNAPSSPAMLAFANSVLNPQPATPAETQ